jgi:hypothetical protein
MRRLIANLERAALRRYEFVMNVIYYLRRGHRIGKAIELARDTL